MFTLFWPGEYSIALGAHITVNSGDYIPATEGQRCEIFGFGPPLELLAASTHVAFGGSTWYLAWIYCGQYLRYKTK